MHDPVFFSPARRIDAAEAARITGATLETPHLADLAIEGIAPADSGGRGRVVFVEGRKAAALLPRLRASAVFCRPEDMALVPAGIAVLTTPAPSQAFALLARVLFPSAARPGPVTGETGISPRATVAASARLGQGVVIEAGAVIGPQVAIGAGTVVAPNAVIGPSCQIGKDGYVGPGVTLLSALVGDRVIIHAGVRIGSDGFGFVPGRKGLEKVPQIGRVVVQDDVEIGANTTIDRGAMDDTIIGDGTKIDNLVQIGHNVRIGRCCAIAAHTGISGSVTIGDYVMLGGRVGIADHVTIGQGAQLAGGSGVIGDVPAGARWGGTPAQPVKDWLREVSMSRAMARDRAKAKDRNG